MKKKILAVAALSAVMALSLGVGIVAQDLTEARFAASAAEAASVEYDYEVDSLELHSHSNTNTQLFMILSTMDGEMALTGYSDWVAPDDATNALKAQMLLNGKSMAEIDGVALQGMNITNALCLSGYYLPVGGTIVIPEGATFDNGIHSMIFMRTFTITWNGEAYEVTRSAREFNVPEYEMPDGMLSDFTEYAALRLADTNYQEAAINNPGGCWGSDYQAYKISGEYLSAEEAPDGSTNGAYKMSWADTATLYYPSIMFTFPQKVEFDPEDELVIRMYLSEGMDTGYELWVTSALTPNIWDPQTRIAGVTLAKGEWIEIHLNAADYADENGEIVPIAFTFHYSTSLAVTPAAEVYFDTATFVSVPKVLADEYKVEDISEVVALGEGISFVGEGDGGEEFDMTQETNVKFVRTDAGVNVVKMKMTISDLSDFDLYFVLNGTGLYFDKGGVYFWLSEKGFNIGYTGKNFEREALPASVVAGEAFELELRAIPYYVNGIKTGYFAQALINGEEIGESGYIASANCSFGNWFGFYMHNTTDAVSVKLEPVVKAEKTPVELTLKAQMNATQIDTDGYVKLETKLSGNYLNQSAVTLELVSGSEYAMLDEEGYLNGIADGEAVVVAKITNEFGTFTSNELKITVGNGGKPSEQPNDSEQKPSLLEQLGCGSVVGGLASGIVVMGIAAVALFKKKEN